MENQNFRWLISAVAVAAVMGVAGYAASIGGFRPFMNGQLSSKHSAMERDCVKCHAPWKGVSDTACIGCHGDKKHVSGKKAGKDTPTDTGCFSCHREHGGRVRNIRLVESEKCKVCHAFDRHPDLKKRAVSRHPYYASDCGHCHENVKHPATADLSSNFDKLGKRGFSHKQHLERMDINPDNCDLCHEKPDGGGPFRLVSLEDACGSCHTVYDVKDKTKPATATENCPICHIAGETRTLEALKSQKPMKAFSHSRHSRNKCMDCHDGAAKSDVVANFMPAVSKCRDCHQQKMISSDCVACHSFHPSRK